MAPASPREHERPGEPRTRASAIVRRTNLSAAIADRIAEQIVSGKLRPGTRLQSERELCDLYGVGRSSIREAVKALESRGLVAGKQGEGRYVRAPDLTGLVQPPSVPVSVTENEVRYLYEARRIVEPAMCALAAARGSARDIAAARRLLERHERRIAEGSYGGAEDTAFHMRLAVMAENPLLARLLEAILVVLHTTREPALRSTGGLQFSLAGHWEVMQAVAAHDADAARAAMLAHLLRAERSAVEIVRRRADATEAE
jgi:DNA-binding FadR family transcriptional regulator